MSRKTIVIAVALFAVHAVGTRGQVVNYYGFDCGGASWPFLDEVPASGFVATDIHLYADDGGYHVFEIQQCDAGGQHCVTEFMNRQLDGSLLSFTSGIAFDPGHQITINPMGDSICKGITLSGYIPGSGGTVPAVDGIGLAIIATVILAGGALLLRKDRHVA